MTDEHKHITFHDGHITWKGEERPSEAVMEAFEALYQFVLEHEKELVQLRKQKADKPAIYGPPPIKFDDIYFGDVKKDQP